MLIAVAIAVVAVDLAPVALQVHAAPTVPVAIVEEALREAEALWRRNGIVIVTQTTGCEAEADRLTDSGSMPAAVVPLDVEFDDATSTAKDYTVPIGSIVFSNHVAVPDIHLSYANALWLLRDVYGDGGVNTMTTIERRTRLARALGRALAHEIGHYLLASKDHTSQGLMKAQHKAGELFGPSRHPFELTESQRSAAVARLADQGTSGVFTRRYPR